MVATTDDFKLTPEDRLSSLWRRLDQHTARKLESLRRQNDALNLDQEKTAALRGRISETKALRQLLAMDSPSPAEAADGRNGPLPVVT
jgi:hypothetical protein